MNFVPTVLSAASTSTTRSSSLNAQARAITSPLALTTTLCPSKTSSSCPPTRLTNAIGHFVSSARSRNIASRSSRRPLAYGEAFDTSSNVAPCLASSKAGPLSVQMSSQISRPTAIPLTLIIVCSPTPGWK